MYIYKEVWQSSTDGHPYRKLLQVSEYGPRSKAGLPDALISNQKSQFGNILVGLGMENVFIFYDHLECFMAIWYNSWQFGIVCGHVV
jgi:hypothetical protein